MLKIAVIGANTLIGRELVNVLDHCECSVLPLHCDAVNYSDDNDQVLFAPDPTLLNNIDVVIIAKTPTIPDLLANYTGRILYINDDYDSCLEVAPTTGLWPVGTSVLRMHSVLERVLAIASALLLNVDTINGTYLQSVAYLGDRGIDGLVSQSIDILNGNEPKIEQLGYRGAFEVIPSVPTSNIIYVKTPTFHGDVLILYLTAINGKQLSLVDNISSVKWCEHPPTSRDVAVSANILVHCTLLNDKQLAILTLGFDPILWGIITPIIKLLGI